MPQTRTTHVVVPRYPLTDFLFEGMHAHDDVRIVPYRIGTRHPLRGLFRFAEVYLLPWLRRSAYLDADIVERLRTIEPDDVVLFFAIENRKDLQLLRKFVAARTQIVWLWNPVRNYRRHALSRLVYRTWLRATGMQVYTFDPDDARENGLLLAPQVYRHAQVDTHGEAPRQDVFFVGMDKGRLPGLQALRTRLEAAGLTTHFHVFPDKRRQYSAADRAQLSERWLSYQENLQQVAQSRAILELLQASQSGPTIRSMEATFLGRKLITDNVSLRDSPLYHPSRMFILGQDDLADIARFMDTPLVPLDPTILRSHEIEHWVRHFRDRS